MSIHLVTCAARVTGIRPSYKLVLLALAEDSRDGERHASPGLEALMRWSNLSRSRVFVALKELVELELVYHVSEGRKGRHAVWQVFPNGCCERHGMTPAASHQGDAERPVDNLTGETLSGPQGLVSGSTGSPFGAHGVSPGETPPVTLPQELSPAKLRTSPHSPDGPLGRRHFDVDHDPWANQLEREAAS